MAQDNTIKINELDGWKLNVSADLPDLRDRIYEPALLDLKLGLSLANPAASPVLNQGQEGACTGFALASAINLQNNLRAKKQASISSNVQLPNRVSPRMLYEMAKLHDEWPDEDYEGSSIRGALKGFFHNGACDDTLAPYVDGEANWNLTKEQAKDARNVGLGAYFRLRPQIIDYHAALNEVGVVYVSAHVHRGWQNPKKGIIKQSNIHEGGHAFIIVGYDQQGFLIQNSWGTDWGGFNGQSGIAHWSYADWADNIMDAWVLRLSVPTPQYFDLTHTPKSDAEAVAFQSESVSHPKRSEVVGHFIHLDDGKLVETGRYATPLSSIQETADVLVADENRPDNAPSKYDHLMFYMHGGLNNSKASAWRIRQMKAVFKRNRIYPIHFMWETGISEELKDILFGAFQKAEGRVGGLSDWGDLVIEKFARLPGRAIWREMKRDAARSFVEQAGGTQAVKVLLDGNRRRANPLKIHFVAHSAGSILLAELLRNKQAMETNLGLQSCSLMAPACTVDLFKETYVPLIGKPKGIDSLQQYNLIDQRELDDTVGPYRKSLLYFVSRAFEEEQPDGSKAALLGMEKYSSDLALKPDHKIHYAGRHHGFTKSKTHGGFDNDQTTMNRVLETILGSKPSNKMGFQDEELLGY